MYKAVKENDGTYSIRYSKHGLNWEVDRIGVRGCNVRRILNSIDIVKVVLTLRLYHESDTIEEGPYKGFVVVTVSRGWYTVYHPSNGKDATTKIRWAWGY